MDLDAFQADLLAALRRHGVPMAVVIFRDGGDVVIRCFGTSPGDDASSALIGRLADEAILANQEEIGAAMRDATARTGRPVG